MYVLCDATPYVLYVLYTTFQTATLEIDNFGLKSKKFVGNPTKKFNILHKIVVNGSPLYYRCGLIPIKLQNEIFSFGEKLRKSF